MSICCADIPRLPGLESIIFQAGLTGVHRNTLNYRLNKIERRLGYSLQDPFLRLNLQNALLIEQILFHHHNIEEQAVMPALHHD